MKLLLVGFAMSITLINLSALGQTSDFSCTTPKAHIVPINNPYYTHISIDKSYPNTDVYIDKHKLKNKTDNNGQLDMKVSEYKAGRHRLKIKHHIFNFCVNGDLLIKCIGKGKNFACETKNN